MENEKILLIKMALISFISEVITLTSLILIVQWSFNIKFELRLIIGIWAIIRLLRFVFRTIFIN